MEEFSGNSVMSDIDKTEQEINQCFFRLETLERNLKYRPMTNEERELTEKDVAELKKILLRQENNLKSLRKANRGSAFIAVIVIIAAFLLFGLYKMYLNVPVSRDDNDDGQAHLHW